MINPAFFIENVGLGDGSLVVNNKAQRGNELDWMQSTGLTDKNGKEIFEGDIMKWKKGKWRDACGIEGEDRKKIVEWESWEWEPFSYQGYDGDTLFHPREGEIIGNIFQNSELL